MDTMKITSISKIPKLILYEYIFFCIIKHLTANQIEGGIKSGNLFQGTLNISMHNYLEVSKYFLIAFKYI